MIPVSLYVTLEIIKLMQVYHIHNDLELYDAGTNKRTECRALNITEELGQVDTAGGGHEMDTQGWPLWCDVPELAVVLVLCLPVTI